MPLVRGKEVDYDEKKAIEIQQRINTLEELRPDLKGEVDPKEMKELVDIGFGRGWSIFEKEDEEGINRKTRYSYFKEMDTMEFVHRALEIVADDSTQKNDDDDVMRIYSDDEDIKSNLEDLFLNVLDMNNELWNIAFESCKMGDNFFEIIVNDYKNPKEIVFLRYLEPEKVERVEDNGRLVYYSYKTRKIDRSKGGVANEEVEVEYKLQPWQIVHFKLENKSFDPYGGSLLYPGIRTYRRLSLLEDIMLVYRISRAPERRVFYIDVGNLNKVEAKRFLEKIKTSYRTQPFIDEEGKIDRRAQVLSITSDIFVPVREGQQGTKIETLQGGEALHNIDDLKYFRDKILRTMNIPPAYLGEQADRSRGCLHPDTMIKLVDGRNISIKQITEEYEKGKVNYVYSINEETLEWEIKPILWAGITRKNAEVLKVKIDNEKEIICTPDHKFMLKDGTYCEAKDLKPKTSLMPINTKVSSTKKGDKLDGYEKLLSNKSGKWDYTHRIIKKENGKVVHHKDFNKLNNSPDNLILMEAQEHLKLHASMAKELSNNIEIVEKRNKSIRDFYSTEDGLLIIRKNQKRAVNHPNRLRWLHSEEHRQLKREQIAKQRESGTIFLGKEGARKISEKTKERWKNEEYRKVMKEVCRNGGLTHQGEKHPNYNKEITFESIVDNYISGMTRKDILNKLDICPSVLKLRLNNNGYANWTDFVNTRNHKVVSIEKINETFDVYDITIKDNPNFATLCQVVLHNSLAQMDIKFSRFIERIQSQIVKGLNKIAALQLFFSGSKKDELSDFHIELTPPSNIKEITEIDLVNQKMGLIGTIQGLQIFSNSWILKNILKMSDKEITDIALYKRLETQQQGEEQPEGVPPGMPPGGAEGEIEMPPEGEMPPGAETPPGAEAPEELAAGTIIKTLGKDFIIENSEDFFRVVNYIKSQNGKKPEDKTFLPLFEVVSDIISKKNEIVEKTTKIKRLFLINEFGGLGFEKNKPSFIKLYKKNKNKQGKEIFEEEIHNFTTISESRKDK